MLFSNRFILLTIALAAAVSPAVAVAQTAGGAAAPPDAQALYDGAVAKIKRHDYAGACPDFERVTKMLPDKLAVSLDVAECYKEWGKLATSWRHYVTTAERATKLGQAAYVTEANKQAAALKPKLATLVIDIPASVRELPGLTIALDERALDRSKWAEPQPVDVGAHKLVVTATGYETQTIQIDIAKDGAQTTKSIAPLQASKPVPAAPSPSASAVTTAAPALAAPEPRNKLPGFIAGGVGVAALIAGGALVGVAAGAPGDIATKLPRDENGKSRCLRLPQPGEDPECATLRASAASASAMGNAGVGLLVGGGALIAGAAVYLLLPSRKASDSTSSKIVPFVGSQGGMLVWTGSF